MYYLSLYFLFKTNSCYNYFGDNMDNRIIIANIVGVLIIICNIIGNQSITKKKMIIWNCILNILCVIQYLILGALTGSVSCLIAIVRNIAFYRYEIVPKWLLFIYLFIVIAFNIPYITDAVSVIPILCIGIYGFALSRNNVKKIKLIGVIVDSISAIFDFYNNAYVTMFNCIVSAISGLISYFRIDNNKVNN